MDILMVNEISRLLIPYFLKKLNKLILTCSYTYKLPMIVGIADHLEKICIITMLKSYPELTTNLAEQ